LLKHNKVMNNYKVYIRLSLAILVLTGLSLISSCVSDDPILISEIITTEVSKVTPTSLTTGGTITAVPGAQITSRGVVWSRGPEPTIGKLSSITNDGTGAGSFQSELTGLSLVKYYIRAYAIVNNTTYYGNEVAFDLSSIIPKLSSLSSTEFTTNSANVQTTIDYTWLDPITEKGICWGTSVAPTIDKSNTIAVAEPSLNFTITLSNLTKNQVYYARAYAVNQLGVFYGNSVQMLILSPPAFGQVEDIDGNKYKTVLVGTKTWMAENLKVTKYSDGTQIPALFNANEFKNTGEGAYTAYIGSEGNVQSVGYLYNGYARSSDRNVCMNGWRVPGSEDWQELADVMGGMETAGGRLKAISNLWKSPNLAATDESGFSGLPGGSYCSVCLSNTGSYADFGTDGYWWSKDQGEFFYLTNNRPELRTKKTASVNDGLSIRCVRN
jgi:uncharacterized protein (TIGR02145 family)